MFELVDDVQLENFIVRPEFRRITVSIEYDYVLMLDVIEKLLALEELITRLSRISGSAQETRMIVSTGNVAFLIVRLMLLPTIQLRQKGHTGPHAYAAFSSPRAAAF